jgi:hypothetical protein
MWKWITERDDYRKEPSVEEQLSDILGLLCGRSLKSQTALWTGYTQLRRARNSFVHEVAQCYRAAPR